MGILQREVLSHQYKMLYSEATYPALVCGFGAGKSESLVMKALKQLFETQDCHIAIYEPTVDLIKRIMYPRFEEILGNTRLAYKLNKSEGVLTIFNVGTIIFRSLENPSRIIGYEVHHSHIDELDTLDEDKARDAWMKIIARNRKRIPNNSKNTVSVYTTPEGYRFVYKQWKKKFEEDMLKAKTSNYELIKGSTYDNPFLPPEYIEALENSYPKHLIKAYLNGEFVNLEAGQVYISFDVDSNHTDFTMPSGNEDIIHLGMDFNVGHMSAVAVIIRNDIAFVVDEICDQRDTPSMINEIKYRYDGRTVIVYPDASGNSRKTVDASKSDIALIRDANIRVNAPSKNPPVKDRILTVNSMFCNAKDIRRLFVNTTVCRNLTDNLNEQAYDESGNPRKTNNVDHLLDALGYVIHRKFGITSAKTTIMRMKF
jgi:PBSX family phage terminase large subunit